MFCFLEEFSRINQHLVRKKMLSFYLSYCRENKLRNLLEVSQAMVRIKPINTLLKQREVADSNSLSCTGFFSWPSSKLEENPLGKIVQRNSVNPVTMREFPEDVYWSACLFGESVPNSTPMSSWSGHACSKALHCSAAWMSPSGREAGSLHGK